MAEQRDPHPTYNVISGGQPRQGFEREAVVGALAQLKMAPALIEQLLAGRRLVVKRGVDADIADSYRNRLWRAGLEVEVVAAAAPALSASLDPAPASEAAPPLSAPISATQTAPTPALSSAARAADRRLATRWLVAAALAGTMPAALIMLLTATVALLLYHAIDHATWLQVPPWWWSGLLYLLPLLAGLVVIATLLLPLLPLPRAAAPTPLDRSAEPELWLLLDGIADEAGLRSPTALLLTPGSDCHASLAHGSAGWRRGDTVLTLGLALLHQPPAMLRATLAAAMVEALPATARVRRLADKIEQWLATHAEGRDRWQQRLTTRAAADDAAFGITAVGRLEQRGQQHYQRLTVRLFRPLHRWCQTLTLPARRALLLEQDRIAASVVGLDNFADWRRTQRCWQAAADWAEPFALEHPVENLPLLITHAALQPTAAATTALERELIASPAPGSRWPGERTRIERVAAMALKPMRSSSEPPCIPDMTAHELAVTAESYRARGLDVAQPLPADQTEQLVALLREREQAAASYFNGWLHPDRGWRLPSAALLDALPLNDATEQLHVCVNEIRRLTPDRARLLAQRERLLQQLADLKLGSELLSLRQPFTFRTPGIEIGALPSLIDEKQAEIDQLTQQLTLQESIMGGRLALGLRLSGHAAEEITALHAGLDFFAELLERVTKLQEEAELLAALAQRPLDASARPTLARLQERVAAASERLLRRLEQAPPPPQRHVDSAARRAQRRLPPTGDAAASAARARLLCDACRDFHLELSALAAGWASGSEESYAIETIRRVDRLA